MAEKSPKKRYLTQTEWARFERLHAAGTPVREIAVLGGVSERWVYLKLKAMRADPASVRLARQHDALMTELARIQADLPGPDTTEVMRRARALSAVAKANRDLEGLMTRDTEKAALPDDDDASLEELRAELERRFALLDDAREAQREICGDGPAADEGGADGLDILGPEGTAPAPD